MKRILSSLVIVLLFIGLWLVFRPVSAIDAYRDKVASCQTLAREGLNDSVNYCRSELPALQRAALEEERSR